MNTCTSLLWDQIQLEIIESKADELLLVEAGPGTGKTAVACARVAHLVDKQVIPPSKIWLFSFTRTAVKEIRDRIITFLANQHDAAAVKITTLDSQVWYMRQGFEEQDIQQLLGSYESNIQGMTELLRRGDEGLLQYLSEIDHIIIDEAQDLVGPRAELVTELCRVVSDTGGITVFTDSAQAIYGFTTELGGKAKNNHMEAVPSLRTGIYGQFTSKSLKQIYRTSDEKLAHNYMNLRDVVLSDIIEGEEKLEQIRAVVGQISSSDLPVANKQDLGGRDDVLLLYRMRSQVLRASAFLWGEGVSHKLRMGNLPPRLSPWIARVFSDYTNRSMSKDVFLQIWGQKVATFGGPFSTQLAHQSWIDLYRLCANRRGALDLKELRKVLSRDRPPVEFLLPEEALPGPTVGTIHASKGREADEVRLMIADELDVKDSHVEQIDEEGRIVFVGATRARERLMVGPSYKTYASRLDGSGRMFKLGTKKKSPRAQVEFGLQGDINQYKMLNKDEWEEPDIPLENQEYLWQNCLTHVPVYAECGEDTDWAYWLHTKDDVEWLASFNQTVNWNLFDIGKILAGKRKLGNLRPGGKINYLNMIGSASVVLDPEDDEKPNLIEPFNKTGIYLIPVISGFTNVYFNKCRGESN